MATAAGAFERAGKLSNASRFYRRLSIQDRDDDDVFVFLRICNVKLICTSLQIDLGSGNPPLLTVKILSIGKCVPSLITGSR